MGVITATKEFCEDGVNIHKVFRTAPAIQHILATIVKVLNSAARSFTHGKSMQ